MDDKNIVERKSVKTGMHKDKMIAILEGVSESDWVVVNGLLSAIPGKVVSTAQQPIKGTENTGKTDPASDVPVKP